MKQPVLLQINVTANWGSTGKIAEQIGQTAAAHGWKSYIAYGRNSAPSRSELIHVGSKVSQAAALLQARLFDNDGLANRIATKRLVRKIEEIKPDIIHLHNLHGYYINYRILFDYLNSSGIPVVWTLHDCWAFTGHCGHFIGVGCDKWKTGCSHCPFTGKSYPAALWRDRSYRNFELKKSLFAHNRNIHLVPVSQWLSDIVEQSILKRADRRVIHNGIDLSIFSPKAKPDGNQGNKHVVLGVSNIWTQGKGLYDFFRLRDLLGEDEYEIVLAGLTEAQIKALPKGIKGIARTDSPGELASLYSAAAVFVNPTYVDTFPSTNLEALACGTPVVTYRTGGSPETIDDTTGIVVGQGDIDQLADAIRMICKEGKSAFSASCRARAEREFDKTNCFEQYITLYGNLL